MLEAIIQGVTTGTEIYAKVVEFMKKEVLSKTCVDFLAPRVRYFHGYSSSCIVVRMTCENQDATFEIV